MNRFEYLEMLFACNKPGAMVVLTMLVLGLVGCKPQTTPTAEPTQPLTATPTELPIAAPTEPPTHAEPVTYRIGTTYIMDTINPNIFEVGWTIRWLFFDSLNQAPSGGVWEPALAESWEVSDDGLVWTFKIREGVTFHDGTPCDANAIAWSMNWMRQVDNTSVAYLFEDYTSFQTIEALDETTLQITLSEPVGNLMYRIWYAYVLPESVWGSMHTYEEMANFDDISACVGTGAYKCLEWAPNEYLVLEAYKDHWRGKPVIDRIIYQQYDTEDAMVQAILAGEVDVLLYVPGTAVETLQADQNIYVSIQDGTEYDELVFNSHEDGTQPKSLGDPIIREAIDYALDRQKIADIAYLGNAKPGGSVVPPAQGVYHNPNVTPTLFDMEHANNILDNAGYLDRDSDGIREWSDGSPLEYRLMTTDAATPARIMELIQEMMSEIGISIIIELLDEDSIDERLAPSWDFDIHYMSYSADVDPGFSLITVICDQRIVGGWNYSGYCDEKADEYYWAQATAITEEERVQVIHEAQQYIYNERPWLVVVYTPIIQAYRTDKITNLSVTSGYADLTYVLSILSAEIAP